MRARGEGTIYQRKDGRWCAQITLQRGDGASYRRTLYGATQREVRDKTSSLRHLAEAGVTHFTRLPTVSEYGLTWLAHKRALVDTGHLAQATLVSYEDTFRLHVEPLLGRWRLNELNRDILRDFVNAKQRQTSARGRPLSPRTVQYIHGLVRNMLNEAVDDEYLASNPMLRVKPPRQRRQPVVPLTTAETERLLSTGASDRLGAVWFTLATTGLRVGELLALTWDDVDLDARTVSVVRSVGRVGGDRDATTGRRTYRLLVKTTKTPGSEATIALPDVTCEVLREHRRRQAEERLRSTRWMDNTLVFSTPIGTAIDSRNLRRIFSDLLSRAGIKRHTRQHDLRHLAASALIAEGVDIAVIKGVLRHTRIATTSDIYGHLLEETQRAAADAMDVRMRRVLEAGNAGAMPAATPGSTTQPDRRA